MSHESSYSFIINIIIDIQPVRTYIYPYIYIFLYLYIYITSIRSIVSLILLLTASPPLTLKIPFWQEKTKKWAAGGLYFLFFGLFRDVRKPLSMRFFFERQLLVLFHIILFMVKSFLLVCLFWCVLLNNFWVALPNTLVICLTQLTHLNLFDVGQSVI